MRRWVVRPLVRPVRRPVRGQWIGTGRAGPALPTTAWENEILNDLMVGWWPTEAAGLPRHEHHQLVGATAGRWRGLPSARPPSGRWPARNGIGLRAWHAAGLDPKLERTTRLASIHQNSEARNSGKAPLSDRAWGDRPPHLAHRDESPAPYLLELAKHPAMMPTPVRRWPSTVTPGRRPATTFLTVRI